jgi:hypothetical protein
LIAIEASQVEASEDDVYSEDVSSVASGPSGPLLPTSLASVPASDRETTPSAAQITGSGIESACAVVAIAAGAQLSKEFLRGDTSSTHVMQEQMKSESEVLTAKTQEKYEIHEQATSS